VEPVCRPLGLTHSSERRARRFTFTVDLFCPTNTTSGHKRRLVPIPLEPKGSALQRDDAASRRRVEIEHRAVHLFVANVSPRSIEQFAAFVKAESEKYERIIRETGVKPE